MKRDNTFFIKRIFFLFVLVIILASICIVAKSSNSEGIDIQPSSTKEEIVDTISFGVSNFDTLNPIISKNKNVQYVSKIIYDSLIEITIDFKTECNLAKEVSKLNDTSYIVTLKDNIYWHDGNKFTADDVIFTIENIKLVKESIYSENVAKINKVEKIDEFTVKILLEEKVEFFEYLLTFPIIQRANHEENIANLQRIIGTGEFRVIEQTNAVIKLEYIGKEESKIKNFEIKIYNSVQEMYNDFRKGTIDIIATENRNYTDYIGKIGYNVSSCQDRKYEYIIINTKNEFLNNKNTRQFLNEAINRKSIIYNVYNNDYTETDFPLNTQNFLYKENLNQTNIKNRLNLEGFEYIDGIWQNGEKKLQFTILVNKENKERVFAAENIKTQLERVGITIDIIKASEKEIERHIKRGTYDLILTGNILPITPTLSTYFGQGNYSNYSNEEIQILLKETNNIENSELLKEKFSEIIQIYYEDVPFISLYQNKSFVIYNKNLRGNMEHNWYNIFYDISNWYKVEKKI